MSHQCFQRQVVLRKFCQLVWKSLVHKCDGLFHKKHVPSSSQVEGFGTSCWDGRPGNIHFEMCAKSRVPAETRCHFVCRWDAMPRKERSWELRRFPKFVMVAWRFISKIWLGYRILSCSSQEFVTLDSVISRLFDVHFLGKFNFFSELTQSHKKKNNPITQPQKPCRNHFRIISKQILGEQIFTIWIYFETMSKPSWKSVTCSISAFWNLRWLEVKLWFDNILKP